MSDFEAMSPIKGDAFARISRVGEMIRSILVILVRFRGVGPVLYPPLSCYALRQTMASQFVTG